MLRKFLKYDIKSLSRFMVPIIIVIVIAIAVGMLSSFFGIKSLINSSGEMNVFDDMAGVSAILIIFFSFIVLVCGVSAAQIFVLVDFYKSTGSDEAYLTFTLPARAHDILRSKIISSIMWISITSVIAVIGYFVIVLAVFGGLEVQKEIFEEFWEMIPNMIAIPDGYWLPIALAIVQLLATFVNTQILYFAAIFFGTTLVTKNKVLVSIACVLGFEFLYELINGIINTIIEAVMMSATLSGGNVIVASCVSYGVMICIITAFSILFYYSTVHMMEKKLNLA